MDALGLKRPPGLVSIVGGGGKSSLMFALARGLPGRVVATTTTRIFAAQTRQADQACSLDEADWRARLDAFDSELLVYGGIQGEHALGVPPELPGELLAHPRVDWVVNEADGSRMLPVKAPADHEPVVPGSTSLLVAVAGIDALSGAIRDVAHRPERVGSVTGLAPHETLTPEALAVLLSSPRGGLKGLPAGRARLRAAQQGALAGTDGVRGARWRGTSSPGSPAWSGSSPAPCKRSRRPAGRSGADSRKPRR